MGIETVIDSIYQIISAVVTWLVVISLLRITLGTLGIVHIIRHPDAAIGVSKTTWVLMFVFAPITAAIVYAVFYIKGKNIKSDDDSLII